MQSGHEAAVQLLSNDFANDILEMGAKSLPKYQSQYLTGASVLNATAIIAWFNNQAYHSSAISLNMLHNAIAKLFVDKDSGIDVINKPFKFIDRKHKTTDELMMPPAKEINLFGYTFTFAIGVALSIYTASYAMFYVKVN